MKIYITSKFKKAYQKLSIELKIQAQNKENIFCKNPFDAQLKTHKLHGKV